MMDRARTDHTDREQSLHLGKRRPSWKHWNVAACMCMCACKSTRAQTTGDKRETREYFRPHDVALLLLLLRASLINPRPKRVTCVIFHLRNVLFQELLDGTVESSNEHGRTHARTGDGSFRVKSSSATTRKQDDEIRTFVIVSHRGLEFRKFNSEVRHTHSHNRIKCRRWRSRVLCGQTVLVPRPVMKSCIANRARTVAQCTIQLSRFLSHNAKTGTPNLHIFVAICSHRLGRDK